MHFPNEVSTILVSTHHCSMNLTSLVKKQISRYCRKKNYQQTQLFLWSIVCYTTRLDNPSLFFFLIKDNPSLETECNVHLLVLLSN